ncbi:MAG: hypothetical protein J7J20_03275 [Desulfurococcales archaeon]|nr:hypothetical protein [Desulfurococcales archaeon]
MVEITPCDVFVHVKGYSRARVTHVDIESPVLNIRSRGGTYAYIYGISRGFRVVPKVKITAATLTIKELVVRWEGPLLLKPGERSVGFLGFKAGGVYVGFKKELISKLEKYCKEKGVLPQ